MSLALAAAVVGASVAPQWYRDGALPNSDAALAAIAACGIDGATIKFDDLLMEDVVVLPGRTVLSDQVLSCLAQASFDTGFEIPVPSEFVGEFYRLRAVVSAPWNVELARGWLSENGYRADLPAMRDGEADEEFARRIEQFCDAQGALASHYGPHTIDPAWLPSAGQDSEPFGTATVCLLSVGTAANFTIGFIGNELGEPKSDSLRLARAPSVVSPDLFRAGAFFGNLARISLVPAQGRDD